MLVGHSQNLGTHPWSSREQTKSDMAEPREAKTEGSLEPGHSRPPWATQIEPVKSKAVDSGIRHRMEILNAQAGVVSVMKMGVVYSCQHLGIVN